MLLYTIQHLNVLKTLEEKGFYQASADFIIDETFLKPYQWYVSKAKKHLPKWDSSMPVWVWADKPDLRSHRFIYCKDLPKTIPHVLLTLEVPETEVLLSDFELWHCVLNNFFIAEDESDLNKEQTPDEITKSWDKCLYLGSDSFKSLDPKLYGSTFKLQGIMDCIRLEQVRDIKKFNIVNKG